MNSNTWSDVLGNNVTAAEAYQQYLAERTEGETLSQWMQRTSRELWGAEHDDEADFTAMAQELEDAAGE